MVAVRSTLAVKLLRTVMNWDDDTTGSDEASLTRTLSRLAEYKYNTYQQYAPGLQFHREPRALVRSVLIPQTVRPP